MEQQKTVLTWKVALNLPDQDYLLVHVFENDIFCYSLQVLKSDQLTIAKKGDIIKSTIVEYNYLSPDGITISMDNFSNRVEAQTFFIEWQKRFEKQGYYSSSHYGRIPLDILSDFCQLCRYIAD